MDGGLTNRRPGAPPTRALSHIVPRHDSHRVCLASECRPDGVYLSHLHPAYSVMTDTAMADNATIGVSDATDTIIEKLEHRRPVRTR